VKELEDEEVTERQSVTFLCEVNCEDVDGRWYTDNTRIKHGDNVKIRHEGEHGPQLSHNVFIAPYTSDDMY
jgi:hypothetical protein